MKIEREFFGDVVVLTIRGKIMMDSGVDELREQLEEIIRSFKSVRGIILDLTEVLYVDSAGLGELMRSRSMTLRASRSLVLCGLQPRINRLLETTNLRTAFDIRCTREEALKYLEERRKQ